MISVQEKMNECKDINIKKMRDTIIAQHQIIEEHEKQIKFLLMLIKGLEHESNKNIIPPTLYDSYDIKKMIKIEE